MQLDQSPEQHETRHSNKLIYYLVISWALGIPLVSWGILIGTISGITGAAFLLAAGALVLTIVRYIVVDRNHNNQHAEIVAILERIADASEQSRRSLRR